MRGVLKLIIVALASLFVIAGIAFFWLLRPNPPAEACTPTFDLAHVRSLAEAMPGQKPKEIRVEEVLSATIPEAVLHAGGPFAMATLDMLAYQLNFDPNTVVLDAAMSRAVARRGMQRRNIRSYNDAAWERLENALLKADAIYVTHEHCDHMGGLFSEGKTLYSRAIFTPEQLASPERLRPAAIPDAVRPTLRQLLYEGAQAVAPGVVLIKAPGHTPGSQWMYVRRQDGRELLLVGDSAWHMSNIELEQGPPALLSLLLKNDRTAMACQLTFLHRLITTEPSIQVMPGHDGARLQQLVERGFLTREFL